jgi:hypothetical protein
MTTMITRKKLIQLVLAAMMFVAVCGVVPQIARAWLAAHPAQQVAWLLPPDWGPQPQVNWNS